MDRYESVSWTRAAWRKSTRSGSTGGQCVEVAFQPDAVGLRDSKAPGVNILVSPSQFGKFLTSVKEGRLDSH